MSSALAPRSGGRILVDALRTHGVETVFCVPGESYLEVLDAQRTANDTELGFIRNRQSRLAFSVDLMKALGGGWSAEQGR